MQGPEVRVVSSVGEKVCVSVQKIGGRGKFSVLNE